MFNAPRLIVHGGAWNIPAEYEAAHLAGVQQAIRSAYPALQAGGSALDAVEAAVKVLEADPAFDAGRGAFLNAAGEIELDAIICQGTELSFGAVAALQNILHPVSVARAIMEKSEHCLFVAEGALAFAREMGFEALPPEALLTDREKAYYRQIKDNPDFHTRDPFGEHPRGTVGAVAMDIHGNLAAATSTGGTPRKKPGRVGDTPVIGAGAYADNRLGAASATGWGEAIMKVLLCYAACRQMENDNAAAAAQKSIVMLKDRAEGLGGLICIDRRGSYGLYHNTPKMAFAYFDVENSGEIISGIRQPRMPAE